MAEVARSGTVTTSAVDHSIIWDVEKPTPDDVDDLDAATNACLDETGSRLEYGFRRADRDDKESPGLLARSPQSINRL